MKYIKDLFAKLYKKGAFHVFVGQFLTKFVGFFGSIFIVRLMSKHDYGIITYYENMYSYAAVFAGLGMSYAVLRYVVLGEDMRQKYSYLSYCLRWGLIADFIITMILIFASSFVVKHPADYAPYSWMLIVCAFSLPFHDLFSTLLNNERAMLANNRYAVLSFLISTSVIVGKIMAAKLFGMNGVFATQLVIYIIWGVLIYLSDKKAYFSNVEYIAPRPGKKREIWSYSVQYMITNGLWAVFMLNDVKMLGSFGVNPDSLADFKVAYVFPANISIISSAIGIIVLPYFIKNEKDNGWVRTNFIKVLLATAGAIALVSAVLMLVARPLILIVYGEEYSNIIPMMRVMTLAAFVNAGIRFTFANILAAMGKVKFNMIASGVGVALQIAINALLIPRIGTWGPVITSIIVHMLMSAFLAVVFYNLYYSKKARCVENE